MNWFKKNKKKLIIGASIVAILVFAFWYGGDAPGLKGWSVKEKAAEEQQAENPKGTESAEVNTQKEPGEKTDSETEKGSDKQAPENPDKPEENEGKKETKEDKQTSEPQQEIDPETGKDKYNTDPVPEGKPIPVEPEDQKKTAKTCYCTFSISCASILDNMEYCAEEKRQCVPDDGWIFETRTVAFTEGENVYDVLSRVCRDNGIHMEASFTPMYNSVYIEGINNLYEFDAGEYSGWMYKVNGWFPNYGASRYVLKDGDVCEWIYTCNLGYDIGGGYAMGE